MDVKTYMARLSADQRAALQRLRKAVKAAAPKCEEVISYAIPTLRYKGYGLVSYAAWKNHVSLYAGGKATKRYQSELKGYKTAKGTIRFPNDAPIPASLITKIVKGRMKENEARAKRKAKK